MSLCYESNLKIFRKACYLCAILGVMPFLDFNKMVVARRVFYKIYSIVYILILGVIMAYSYMKVYYYMDFAVEGGLTFTQRLAQSVIDVFSIVLCVMNTLGSAFWNMETWDKFFSKLFKIESLLRRNTPNSFCTKNFNFAFFTSNALFVCCLILQNYLWVPRIGLDKQAKYFVNYYLIYVNHNKMVLIFNFVGIIRLRFEELNHLLRLKTKKQIPLSAGNIMGLHRQLHETVELFNSLFGWQLLLTIIYCALVSLNCVHISGLRYLRSDLEQQITSLSALISILVGLFALSNPILVTIHCDWVMREAQNVVAICYKAQEHLPTFSDDRQELRDLANHAICNKPAFTAAGFFEINRTSLFALFGTLTTYLVIIMQFNQI